MVSVRNLVLGLCLLFPWALPAQALASYEGIAPAELLRRSWVSSSASEKEAIRFYLSDRYPEAVEGLFAKAWLLDVDGKREESVAAYRRALALDPAHLPTLTNLAQMLEGPEKFALLEKRLSLDPAFNHYSAIRDLYFAWLEDARDTARADRFLAEWEARLPGVFVFDFARGLRASNAREWKEAETHYLRAIEKGADDFEVYQRLSDVRLTHLSTAQTPDRANLLQPLFEYAERVEDPSEAYLYLAEQTFKTFDDDASAHLLYRRAFDAHPSGEAAWGAYKAVVANVSTETVEFLRTADTVLPDNPLLLGALGHATLTLSNDIAGAERYYEAALRHSRTANRRAQVAQVLGQVVYEDALHDYDRAAALYRRHMEGTEQAAGLAGNLYLNRLYAGDYTAALQHLLDYERALQAKRDDYAAWFREQRAILQRYTTAAEARTRYDTEHPFLGTWQRAFGDQLNLVIRFAPESVTLSREAQRDLGRVARMLNENGAERYIFAIEGHADGAEADAAVLSRRRAQAVMNALHELYQIPLDRMQTDAYGAEFPSGHADAGNARVEISPLGDISRPSVAVTSVLQGASAALSPGGRLMALGSDPIQVWDVRRGIRLRDLGPGIERKFSPNGRYVAAISSFTGTAGDEVNSLFVYDAKTGLVAAQVPSRWNIRELDWSPTSREVAFTDETGRLVVVDVQAGHSVRSTRIGGHRISGVVLWTNDGRHIVVGQAQERELRVYDAATLRLIRTLPGVNWPHALGQTHDGRYLFAADNKRVLTVWETDWSAPEWRPHQMAIPSLAENVSVHPNLPRVLITDFGSTTGPYNQVVVDLESMSIVAHKTSPEVVTAYFSADGARVFEARRAEVAVLDASTLAEVSVIQGAAVQPRAAAADIANGYFLSGDEEGIHVWDVETGKRLHTWQGAGNLLGELESGVFVGVRRSNDGLVSEVVLYRTSDFSSTLLVRLDIAVDRFAYAAGRIAFAGVPGAHTDFRSGVVVIVDRRSGSVLERLEVPLQTEYLEYGRAYLGGFSGLGLAPDGREVVVSTYWQDGFGHPLTYSRQARIFAVGGGRSLRTITLDQPVHRVSYPLGEPQRVEVASASNTFLYDRATGGFHRAIGLGAAERRLEFPGGSVLWSGDGMRIETGGQTRTLSSDYQLVGVAAFPARKLLVALNRANEIGFYDLQGTRQLSIVNKRGGEWIAFTPSGNFVASPHGTEKVFWSLGDRVLPFEALKGGYERPGVIAERLESIARGRTGPAVPVAPELAAEAFGESYAVRLVTPSERHVAADSIVVEFVVEKRHPSLPEPTLVFHQQGLEVPPEQAVQGLTLVGLPTSGVLGYRRTFPLTEGQNVIDIGYRQGSAQLRGATLRVWHTVRRQTAGTPGAPRLWFLGIGTSTYAISEYNLRFADRDVIEVARMLEQQKGGLYSDVRVKLLLNDTTSNDSITAALHEFLGQASASDVIAIYIAGHGVLSADQTVYYMTHRGDLRRPWTGYPLRLFQDYLRRRPPTQKALVFLDICHAGAYGLEMRGWATAEDAIRELDEGTGLVVLASSTGRERSIEDSRFRGGHGAFTAAILEGIEGRADTGDGFVSVTELQQFVERRVPELTTMSQHPMVPLLEQLRDFPLVQVRPGESR